MDENDAPVDNEVGHVLRNHVPAPSAPMDKLTRGPDELCAELAEAHLGRRALDGEEPEEEGGAAGEGDGVEARFGELLRRRVEQREEFSCCRARRALENLGEGLDGGDWDGQALLKRLLVSYGSEYCGRCAGSRHPCATDPRRT